MVGEKNSMGQDEDQKVEQEISDASSVDDSSLNLSSDEGEQKDRGVHGEDGAAQQDSAATVTSFMVSSSSSYSAAAAPIEAPVEPQKKPVLMNASLWRWSKPLFIVFLTKIFIT